MITKAYIYHLARLTREYIYSLWGAGIITRPTPSSRIVITQAYFREIDTPFYDRTIDTDTDSRIMDTLAYDRTVDD